MCVGAGEAISGREQYIALKGGHELSVLFWGVHIRLPRIFDKGSREPKSCLHLSCGQSTDDLIDLRHGVGICNWKSVAKGEAVNKVSNTSWP